jgi:ribonuclease HI
MFAPPAFDPKGASRKKGVLWKVSVSYRVRNIVSPNTKKGQKGSSERTIALRDNALNIFTDGSSLPHPRRGGIGIRFVTTDAAGDEVIDEHCLPGYASATNNQMEVMACIKALEMARDCPMLEGVNEVWVYTDSMYVTDNVLNAMFAWPKSRWMNRSGRPIENAELWKELVQAIKKVPLKVRFQWIKGHSKNAHNKAVDKLAKQSARGVLNKTLRIATVRRKRTDNSVQVDSVKMEGQTMSVRIITDTYMKTQKLYKYMYQVLAESSRYYGNSDYIYSEIVLRAGHHYEIRVNDTPDNPRIVEVLNELDRISGAVVGKQ